jgi:hypothetical protein
MKALPHAVACHLVEAGDCRVGVGDCFDDAVIESFWSRIQVVHPVELGFRG